MALEVATVTSILYNTLLLVFCVILPEAITPVVTKFPDVTLPATLKVANPNNEAPVTLRFEVTVIFVAPILVALTDPAFKVGVRVARNQSIGILSGQGSNSGLLELLDNTARLKKNDILLTRGSTNNTPFVPGVPVGKITKASDSTNSVSQVADVTFYANLNALGIVSVVISAPDADPRNALVPKAPAPTPIPTVTILVIYLP